MQKGKLIVVKGDATSPQNITPNEIVIIPHCCNNLGAWGAGFVLALSKKWAEPETIYKAFCSCLSPLDKKEGYLHLLGKVCYARVDENILVANMIGQKGTVSANNTKPVKYWALVECMRDIVGKINDIKKKVSRPVVIHCPKFGSDLAGGNWDFILELIREIWLETGTDVVVYEFEG